MIAPLPNCFSMAAMALGHRLHLSFSSMRGHGLCSFRLARLRGSRFGHGSVEQRGTAAPRRGGRRGSRSLPSRSAMVRATRRTRVIARADRPSRSAARSSSACPSASSGATSRSSVEREPRVPARAAPPLPLARRLDPRRARRAVGSPGAACGELAVGQRPGRRRAGRCDRAAGPRAATGSAAIAARRAGAGAHACCPGSRTGRGSAPRPA